MQLTLSEIISLTSSITGKTATSPEAVVLGVNDLLAYKESERDAEPDTVLFGTLHITQTNDDNGMTFTVNRPDPLSDPPVRVDYTMISVNKGHFTFGGRTFQNAIFDKIYGSVNEDSEIYFSGYKLTLA